MKTKDSSNRRPAWYTQFKKLVPYTLGMWHAQFVATDSKQIKTSHELMERIIWKLMDKIRYSIVKI